MKKKKKKISVRTKIRSIFDQVMSSVQNFCYHTFLFMERYHPYCTVNITLICDTFIVTVYLSAVEFTQYLQQFLPLPVFPVRGQLSWLNISSPKLTWLQIKGSIFVIVLFTLKYLMCCINNKHSVHFNF